MRRKALLIGCPGDPKKETYLHGVKKDLSSYAAFLKSPLGGAWTADEVQVLNSPSESLLKASMVMLNIYDYSFVLFGGHGYQFGLEQMVEIQPGVDVKASILKVGARRHTLIIDSCRVVLKPRRILLDSVLAKSHRFAKDLTMSGCRKEFDSALEDAGSGLVTLNACALNEKANDDEELGGFYSSSLVAAAESWYADNGGRERSKRLTVVGAHEVAAPLTRDMSGDRQHPKIEKPGTGPYFPFAVIG